MMQHPDTNFRFKVDGTKVSKYTSVLKIFVEVACQTTKYRTFRIVLLLGRFLAITELTPKLAEVCNRSCMFVSQRHRIDHGDVDYYILQTYAADNYCLGTFTIVLSAFTSFLIVVLLTQNVRISSVHWTINTGIVSSSVKI